MDAEKLKSSFEKVKKDIDFLTEQIIILRKELEEIKQIKTNFKQESSTGNEGVPTDKQTDKQTSNRFSAIVDERFSLPFETPTDIPAQTPTDVQQTDTRFQQTNTNSNTSFQSTKELTELVNTLKNDLKTRFRSLTKQEFHIFSMLFTVDKTQKNVTYRDLAVKLNLSESSIRDYIQKIIKKGIPIEKEKLNNKVTILKIPEEIRQLSTLDNLLRIRNQLPDASLSKFDS
jgi:predicted transcriptional regulator